VYEKVDYTPRPQNQLLYSWDPAYEYRYTDVFPSFSKDGTLLVTSKDVDSSIVTMNADGSNKKLVFQAVQGAAFAPSCRNRLAASPFVSGPTSPRPLLLELAMPLRDADPAVLTPIRRNLVINLAAALSLIATVLIAALGLRSYVRGRRLEEQMEIAERVQSRVLPGTSLDLPGLQIAMEYKASEQIGGDSYDAFSNSKTRLPF
jgi:hypothetical protein